MKLIRTLRKQHKDLLALFTSLTDNLDEEISAEKAQSLREKISHLSSLLKEHFLLEDDFLYPTLKKRPQAEIRDLAYQFAIELGGIKNAFINYYEKYNTPERIAETAADFNSETKAIAIALSNRIKKEDNELFPLLENK